MTSNVLTRTEPAPIDFSATLDSPPTSTLAESLQRLQVPSPHGTWEARFTDQGLVSLDWLGLESPELQTVGPSHPIAERLVQQLTQYFYDPDPQRAEGFEDFKDIPIDWAVLPGTAFHQKVWQAIYAIPFGKTLTYRTIAERIGSPKGFRAVGQATGRNPIPIVIPCHRVLGSSGKLHGFMRNHPDGLPLKHFLLSREGHTLPKPSP